MRRVLLVFLVLLVSIEVEARHRAVRHYSDCTAITGDVRNAGIAYEEGDRVVTSPYRRTPNVNGDMILLSDGRTLLGLEGSRLFRSRDDGCSWIEAGSTDGGTTFRLEVEEGNDIYITAKTRVTASRTNPDLGWFGHGEMFGTVWLYRYDTATRTTTIRERRLGFSGIEAIVQSALKPDTLRLLFTGPHCEALCLP